MSREEPGKALSRIASLPQISEGQAVKVARRAEASASIRITRPLTGWDKLMRAIRGNAR